MDKIDTTTIVDNSADAPLERSIAGRYEQLSPEKRYSGIISRGQSLRGLTSGGEALAAEIFSRWGRSQPGGRESLPFVAGGPRFAGESDAAASAEETPAEGGRAWSSEHAGRVPLLRSGQKSVGTGVSVSASTPAGAVNAVHGDVRTERTMAEQPLAASQHSSHAGEITALSRPVGNLSNSGAAHPGAAETSHRKSGANRESVSASMPAGADNAVHGVVRTDRSMAKQPLVASQHSSHSGESAALSRPVGNRNVSGAAHPGAAEIMHRKSGANQRVVAENASHLSEPRVQKWSDVPRFLEMPRPMAAEGATRGASHMNTAQSGAAPDAHPAEFSGTVTAAGAGRSRWPAPVVTRLPDSGVQGELPAQSSPSSRAGEQAGMLSGFPVAPGRADRGSRPVLLRKLPATGDEAVSSGRGPEAHTARETLPMTYNRLPKRVDSSRSRSQSVDVQFRTAAVGVMEPPLPAVSAPAGMIMKSPVSMVRNPAVMLLRRKMASSLAESSPHGGNPSVPGFAAPDTTLPFAAPQRLHGMRSGTPVVASPAAVRGSALPNLKFPLSAGNSHPASGRIPASPAVHRTSEQQHESGASASAQGAEPLQPLRAPGVAQEDLAQIADRVYQLIEERLTVERERRGL